MSSTKIVQHICVLHAEHSLPSADPVMGSTPLLKFSSDVLSHWKHVGQPSLSALII